MFQNKQKVRAVSGGDPTRVVKVRNVPGGDAARYPKLTLGGESGRHQQVQAVSGGDATRYPIVDLTTEAFQFHAPLRTSVVLERGTGAASYTRATVATVKDFEGNIRNCLSGEVRFEGQRRVRNFLRSSPEDASSACWVLGGTATKSNAGDGVIDLGFPAPADTAYVRNTSDNAVGATITISCDVRVPSGTGTIQILDPFAGQYSIASVSLTTEWKRFSSTFTATNASQGIAFKRNGAGMASAIQVRRLQVEDVTGQSNQNPSEYVSVGVLSSPFHGAMVDGVKYFDYENGNTVSSNVVTEARGAAISQTAAGYFPEAASTNLVLQSSNFGTTWAAVGTPTRSAAAKYCGDIALDLIGDDDGAALEGYTQTITFTGDAVKSVSFLIAQGTSTSTAVQLVDTTATANRVLGVVTWTAGVPTFTPTTGSVERAAEAMANGCYRIFIASSAVTAANTNSLRFYPATDAALAVGATGTVYIGGVQAENATVASSHIPTAAATVTRNLDNLNHPGAGNISATEGTIYAEAYFDKSTGGSQVVCELGDGTANERISLFRNSIGNMTLLVVDGGVTQVNANLGAAADGTLHKVAVRYKANDFAGSLNGAAVVTDTSGTLPTVTTIYDGLTAASTVSGAQSPIKNLRIAQTALTSAELIAVTI